MRPIATGCAIYRLWGRIRLRHLAATLAQDCIQEGGIGGEDVSSLLLRMGVGLDSDPCLMALDFLIKHSIMPAPVFDVAVEQSGEVDSYG